MHVTRCEDGGLLRQGVISNKEGCGLVQLTDPISETGLLGLINANITGSFQNSLAVRGMVVY